MPILPRTYPAEMGGSMYGPEKPVWIRIKTKSRQSSVFFLLFLSFPKGHLVDDYLLALHCMCGP